MVWLYFLIEQLLTVQFPRPRVPSKVSFRTYINYETDVLYLNPAHMSKIDYTYYYNRECTYPETAVLRFVEALVADFDVRTKLKAIHFYKDILRDNGAKYTQLKISDVAFKNICLYLLHMESLQVIGVTLEEECCLDQPRQHYEIDRPIQFTRSYEGPFSDTINASGSHLVAKMKSLLQEMTASSQPATLLPPSNASDVARLLPCLVACRYKREDSYWP